MRYAHIIAAFSGQIWAMQREKLEAIAEFLAVKAAGGDRTDAEIQAAMDGRRPAKVHQAGSVAVVPVVGSIIQRADALENASGGVSADALRATVAQLAADETVAAIVLDIESGGGSTAGIAALADAIWAARGVKPVVAQVNSLAASAAYWIASQADEIVVTPGGEAGSIGVLAVHQDISQKLANEGVKPTVIQAGANKTETANLAPLTEEARAAIQARIDAAYADFVGAVARGRGVDVATVEANFGQGRVFADRELIARGMADRIGTLEDTLARLGAAGPKQGAAQRARAAFAAGGTPTLSTVEAVLRDAGFPKPLATDFVSRGKGAFRQGDPGKPADDSEARAAVRAMRQQLEGLTLPNIIKET